MPDNKYNHQEAFCLMMYQDKVTGEMEVLWNSRDGVTPFVIQSRRGNEAVHENWNFDKCLPDFKPAPGMRIFVDLTPERAHEKAAKMIEKWWDHPTCTMKYNFASKEKALDELSVIQRDGEPDVVEVQL